MTRENQQKTKKTRTTVPVLSRSADQTKKPQPPKLAQSLTGQSFFTSSLAYLGLILVVILLVLMVIAVPLRNFYQGKAEIARLNESILAKQAEKERLLSEIDMYRNESFVQQEARRRLGLVNEGEIAFRILDPKMSTSDSLTTDAKTEADTRPWFEVLFDSVAQPPASPEELPAENPPADNSPADNPPAQVPPLN